MTKNQNIAAGCGGLGCLGLIVLAIAGVVGYYYYYAHRSPERIYSANYNLNSNSNSNNNANQNTNGSANRSSSNSSGETSSYSDDDKHKLFQAAGMTKDQELTVRVLKKIGLFKADGTPADDYPQFIKDHFSWAINNTAFINSVNTPEKAKAYVDAHFD